ncbi:MAG: phosphoribosylamine--glycine ligase [Candidatus Parcubacteria bacterium]|jgi:phosphoribosylamine--glycine ligase
MKILIIGSGGREHALAMAYAKSHRVKKVLVAPGNDFMEESSKKIQTFPTIGVFDFEKISSLAKKEAVDIVDVAQDDPLAAGLVDKLASHGIPSFGPHKKAAEIEWNKAWSREFMKRHNLPIPQYETFSNETAAISFINNNDEKLYFIKASGLAAGKGVIRAETKEEAKMAIKAMKKFGNSGKTFIIEEGMIGEEFSLFAICDGDSYQIIASAQDHKTAYTGDIGPNTGGMGCISPSGALNKQSIHTIKKTILDPFLKGMIEEERPYVGILYLGGMITKKKMFTTHTNIGIIEFNSRWGDPEAEVILPGIVNDYASLIEAVAMDDLENCTVEHDGKIRISIAGCAKGYPDDSSQAKGKRVFGLRDAAKMEGITLFGAGIKKKGEAYVVNGGRIFHLVAEGKTITQARERAMAAMAHIFVEGNNLQYRTDIGWRELERNT